MQSSSDNKYRQLLIAQGVDINNIKYDDLKKIGLVKGCDGLIYDINNLPDYFKCNKLELSNIDLSQFKWPKKLKCKNLIFVDCYNFPERLDLTYVEDAEFYRCNFAGLVSLLMPTYYVFFEKCNNFPKILNCSHLYTLYISRSDLLGVHTLIPSRERNVLLNSKNFSETLDLSHSKSADIFDCDLSKVKHIKWPSWLLYFSNCKHSFESFDFSNVKIAAIHNMDFNKGKYIKGSSQDIDFDHCCYFPEIVDLTSTQNAEFERCHSFEKTTFLKRNSLKTRIAYHIANYQEIKWKVRD